MNDNKNYPLAYFITFTCYGTWLHGDKITSVDRKNNIYNTKRLSLDRSKRISAMCHMVEQPYHLDRPRRKIILKTIMEICSYRSWHLMAAHVRSNHVHLVIGAEVKPDIILKTIKAYASRRLKESKFDEERTHRWTRQGSTMYLWRPEEMFRVIEYVVFEQGRDMEVYFDQRYDVRNHDYEF